MGSSSEPEELLAKLQALAEDDMPPPDQVRDTLDTFAEKVRLWGSRVREDLLARGAYDAVIKTWSLVCYSGISTVKVPTEDANAVREASLKALYSLTPGFPEIIDENGWTLIRQSVDSSLSETTLTQVLKVIRNISVHSEANRERISWEMGMMKPLIALIRRNNPSSEFVREWCGAMKALTLNDDERVAYNKATERKRLIHGQKILPVVTQFLYNFQEEESTLNSIVVLLGTMATNENMCIEIESGNIFPAIRSILKNSQQNSMLIKNSLSLLRYLNISPVVREKCNSFGLISLVLDSVKQYKSHEDVVQVGLSCLAFMTLRNACETAQFLIANGVSVLSEIMNFGSNNIQILKGACLTLRNVAANGGTKARASILEVGGETTLRGIGASTPELEENYVKPALRDLGVWKDPEVTSTTPTAGESQGEQQGETEAEENDDDDDD